MFTKIKKFNSSSKENFISRFITVIFTIFGDVHANYCPLTRQSGNKKKKRNKKKIQSLERFNAIIS